jgi:hypothetical protein
MQIYQAAGQLVAPGRLSRLDGNLHEMDEVK